MPAVTDAVDARREPDDAPVEEPIVHPGERRTLDRVLADEAPLPPPRALELLRPLAREIDRLHARGRIHGAVRPWRIVVEPAEASNSATRVVLWPNVPSGDVPRIGLPGDDAGTSPSWTERDAAYRSPQLLAGEEPRPLDDLYALGVVAYELLTGALPFEVGTYASPTRRPIPPGDRCPELPPAVEGALLAQLSAAPSSRFATGLQFTLELERAAALDRAATRPASIADLISPPTAFPTFRRAPAGLRARNLALAELPDVARIPRDQPRRRRVRRNDYPDLGLPGLWVAVIVVVLCSVYLLPAYYMLRRFLGALFPDLLGSV